MHARGTMEPMIFKPAARYPADPRAVFILALSVFSGATSLALEAAPDSLHAVLPTWAVIFWGVLLVVGSATTLAGMAFQSINGIIAEQVGSVTVGMTTIFYSCIAFYFVGTSALSSVGIILAWGLACLIRWLQLQILINSAYKRKQKQDLLERVYFEIEDHERRERERRQNRRHR